MVTAPPRIASQLEAGAVLPGVDPADGWVAQTPFHTDLGLLCFLSGSKQCPLLDSSGIAGAPDPESRFLRDQPRSRAARGRAGVDLGSEGVCEPQTLCDLWDGSGARARGSQRASGRLGAVALQEGEMQISEERRGVEEARKPLAGAGVGPGASVAGARVGPGAARGQQGWGGAWCPWQGLEWGWGSKGPAGLGEPHFLGAPKGPSLTGAGAWVQILGRWVLGESPGYAGKGRH